VEGCGEASPPRISPLLVRGGQAAWRNTHGAPSASEQ